MTEKIKKEENIDEIKTDGEEVIPGLSQKEYDEIRNKAHEKAKSVKHNWKQKGFWISCDSCDFPHRSWIGPDKVLTDIKDGVPVFSARMS